VTWAPRGLLPPYSRPHLRRFALLSLLIAAEFAVVFYGADWLTAQHPIRIHAYTSAELAIPLVPVMLVPYMTMYVIFWFAPFVLRTTADLDRFAGALARVIAVAGIAFVLLPAKLGFAPVSASESIWNPWLQLATTVSRRYDLVPSLHVALFTVCAGTYARRTTTGMCLLLCIWLAVVAASTVLTHQHHLIDVATGLALGAWGTRVATADAMARLAQPETLVVLSNQESTCSP
jgi:hypothetical protein